MTLTEIVEKATDCFLRGKQDVMDLPVGVVLPDGKIVPASGVLVKKNNGAKWVDRDSMLIIVFKGE